MEAKTSIPNFFGGVSTVSQNQRAPIEVEAMENCDMNVVRGVDKRAGTLHVGGEGAGEWLDVTTVGTEVYTIWVNRSATERHCIIIDEAAAAADIVTAFDVLTGNKITVDGDALGTGVQPLAHANNATLQTYFTSGSTAARKRYSHQTVEDAIFVLNREITTAMTGTAITYKNGLSPTNVRNQNNPQNVDTWSDFLHPPTSTAAFPSLATLITGGDITDAAIWHADDDDVGLQQGFYWAISGTQPPWYQRLPTEGANSHLDNATMPWKMSWNGTKYTIERVTWTYRQSGDSTTNPAPPFIGSAISDMVFHQDRFWFLAGEDVIASRAGDLYNLWVKSIALEVDADPIRKQLQGNRISNGIWGHAFRESLIVLTDGSRQVEIRANGPLTPQSTQFFDSTFVYTSEYIKPVSSGAQLYFMGERDFSNILWEYDYAPDAVTNIAADATQRVHGYIPAESHVMATAPAHDQIFVLTRADTDGIYVNKSAYRAAKKVMNAWYRWSFPSVEEIESIYVYDDFLYLLVWRSDEQGSPTNRLFLERMALGEEEQTTNGSPAQTLGYAVRMDRRSDHIQGSYAAGTGLTTWTLPYLESDIDEIVLSPTWDTATVKMAGTRVPVNTVTVDAVTDTTTVTAIGDYENNADGTDCPACIGVSYDATITLSEQFVIDPRAEEIVHGNLTLVRGKLRHRDSAGYKVKITPEGRATLTKTFTPLSWSSSPLDAAQLEDFGQYEFRVMAHSRNLTIQLVNDSPYPTAWVDMDFLGEFVPNSFSPVR
jgi:hypothetical protein